jgi:hypothetical protein
MIDEDSRIGSLTWSACQKCKHFTENGCVFTAFVVVDQACIIQDGIIYCSMYEESDFDKERT